MGKDVKLEQLKITQERSFAKKQEAYLNQKKSWQCLSDAKDKMNRAFETKQSAFNAQEQAWQDYQSVRNRNGSRIDYLNSAQERAYQNMKNAFERASSAYNCRDGISAKIYASEGHGYKTEAQSYVEERRRLVDECRNAKARHEPYKQTFNNTKVAFDYAKDQYEKAKVVHERANDEFKRSKADFDTAAKAFKTRLVELKAENSKRKDNNRTIATKAGIPSQYLNDVYISKDPDGTINIFFGGVGTPDGPGHGHYSINSGGKVIYRRNPLDPHGHENFENNKDCKKSRWGPRTLGTIDDYEVTFRQGFGDKEGQTLIADGAPSGREFDRRKGHDHYGNKEEGGGRIEDDHGNRGKYSGPGH